MKITFRKILLAIFVLAIIQMFLMISYNDVSFIPFEIFVSLAITIFGLLLSLLTLLVDFIQKNNKKITGLFVMFAFIVSFGVSPTVDGNI